MSSFIIAGLAWEYDFSEDKEKRVDRFEESERGWMMLFLVSSPKLTEKRPRKAKVNVTRVSIHCSYFRATVEMSNEK